MPTKIIFCHSIIQAVSDSVSQSVYQPTSRQGCQLVCQSVSQSITWFVNDFFFQAFSLSANQFFKKNLSVNEFVNHALIDRQRD